MFRHRPDGIHRVLQRLSHTQTAVERSEQAHDHADGASAEPLGVVQLAAQDRELAQRAVQHLCLQIGPAGQHDPSAVVNSSSSGNRDTSA